MLAEPIVVPTSFDAVAEQYNRELDRGISLSGESADYFVEGRVDWLKRALGKRNAATQNILDFGCGVGNAASKLVNALDGHTLIGLDPSIVSIQQARTRWPQPNITWTSDADSLEQDSIDVAYTSGVFHHIPPEARQKELARIFRCLRRGGWFALFENNPWNPGTRWVMSRIPFDQDAITLTPIECRKRMKAVGFQIVDTQYLFFFPRFLRLLRRYERMLTHVPLGAQYVVLGQKT